MGYLCSPCLALEKIFMILMVSDAAHYKRHTGLHFNHYRKPTSFSMSAEISKSAPILCLPDKGPCDVGVDAFLESLGVPQPLNVPLDIANKLAATRPQNSDLDSQYVQCGSVKSATTTVSCTSSDSCKNSCNKVEVAPSCDEKRNESRSVAESNNEMPLRVSKPGTPTLVNTGVNTEIKNSQCMSSNKINNAIVEKLREYRKNLKATASPSDLIAANLILQAITLLKIKPEELDDEGRKIYEI